MKLPSSNVAPRLVAVLMLCTTLMACNDAKRDASGVIVDSGEVDIFSIRVGDCFQDWENALSGDLTELSDLPAVPCSEPHDNEVYHLFDLSTDDFPGDQSLEALAIESCHDPFEAYVGLDYASSRLDYGWVIPTDASWSDGDREIVCFLFDVEFRELTGSMRGARE